MCLMLSTMYLLRMALPTAALLAIGALAPGRMVAGGTKLRPLRRARWGRELHGSRHGPTYTGALIGC